ncbi:galactokinase [Shewanella sp. 10N.286.48.B5]|uniref:galactokinase n=1 Tax=Shewanella sp. 10N.286.48.B5 TaxID=1880834 RepID=UPI000C82F237|nr:galactokinase [Shewanella sp. 10N.286.48.B5]PMH85904.1 galactokinase [Shewanella sp. 10N.286.48.B5]
MSNPAQKAMKLFVQTFGTTADDLYQAPGRVNIIGEHTDYNEGFVLPAAINFHTVIAVKHRSDNTFRAVTDAFAGQIEQWRFGEENAIEDKGSWGNYLKGFTASMAQSGLKAKGMDIAIVGNVPLGAGMSSSAALEVAFGTAISYASQLHLSPLAIAQIAQRGEHRFIKSESGIMDQTISALAVADHALLIDCLELDGRAIAIPDSLSLLIVDPSIDRQLLIDRFDARKLQCYQINELLGVESLREVSLGQLNSAKASLGDELYHRAKHVLTENQRTVNAARALEQQDTARFGQLMAQSQQSMRDDFDISTPEIDALVKIIKDIIGTKGGVRMSDGCVVALIDHELTDAVVNAVEQLYPQQTSLEPIIYLCSASGGAGRIE